MKILGVGGNHKIIKGDKIGIYKTAYISLAPADLSGYEVCRGRSKGCAKACLNTSGHGRMTRVQQARINKTRFMFEHPEEFKAQLYKELIAFILHCKKRGVKPAVRLNAFSDIDWATFFPEIFQLDIQYYDYTKIFSRMKRFIEKKLPKNYYLTFSRSESNQAKVEEIVKLGGNVAVVFNKIPKKYLGKRVVNGDLTDLRFIDPKKVVVGLTPKGKGKRDFTGFVL